MAVGIALVLALATLAASPSLHLALHPDANDSGHHCPITEFAAGHLLVALAAVAITLQLRIAWRSPIADPSAPSPTRLGLPPSRAPPTCPGRCLANLA